MIEKLKDEQNLGSFEVAYFINLFSLLSEGVPSQVSTAHTISSLNL